MDTIPSAGELFNSTVTEWRRKIDVYISQDGFFRDDSKGALLFEITPQLITLLTGIKDVDLKNRKIYEMATSQFQKYMSKYNSDDYEYDVRYNYLKRPGTSEAKPYFVATAQKN